MLGFKYYFHLKFSFIKIKLISNKINKSKIIDLIMLFSLIRIKSSSDKIYKAK